MIDLMTTQQAAEFIRDHDRAARQLNGKTKKALTALRDTRLRAAGIISIGGPYSKDELINDLLERDYPIGTVNEAIHVAYHSANESWSACEYCHPHGGSRCDCSPLALKALEARQAAPADFNVLGYVTRTLPPGQAPQS
jgi:hypothetical protein